MIYHIFLFQGCQGDQFDSGMHLKHVKPKDYEEHVQLNESNTERDGNDINDGPPGQLHQTNIELESIQSFSETDTRGWFGTRASNQPNYAPAPHILGPNDYSYKIPSHADFLIAYSTVPGFYSWRNTTAGSWFIQSFCRVLREHGTEKDLTSNMLRVCRKVAFDFQSNTPGDFAIHEKKQIPCITSMLTRKVYFPPKKDYQEKLVNRIKRVAKPQPHNTRLLPKPVEKTSEKKPSAKSPGKI